MTKKRIGILMMLCMMLVVFSAAGETAADNNALVVKSIDPVGEPAGQVTRELDPAIITAPERPSGIEEYEKKAAGPADEGTTKAVTGDIVSINENSYNVILPCGMTFSYIAPGSNVYALTQDLLKQSALYNQFYKSPKEQADKFISQGMHFNIYDSANDVDIYLYVFTSDIASLYANSNRLTVDEVEYIINYMFTDAGYFKDCSSADYGWVGGNVWMVGDARSTGNGAKLCAFVGGLEIFGYTNVKTDAQYNRMLELLENLTIR